MQQLTFPGSACDISKLFTPAAARNHLRKADFIYTVSEFLKIVPVLARYSKHVAKPRGEQLPYIKSMMAVMFVLEILENCETRFCYSRSARCRNYISSPILCYHIWSRYDSPQTPLYGAFTAYPSPLWHADLDADARPTASCLFAVTRAHGLEFSVTEDITCPYIWDATQPFLSKWSELACTVRASL